MTEYVRKSITVIATAADKQSINVYCGEDKRNLLLSANSVQQMMYTMLVQVMVYMTYLIKNTDCKVSFNYICSVLGMVQCSGENDSNNLSYMCFETIS